MKRFMKVMGVLSIATLLVAGFSYGQKKDPKKATPNLSFPQINTQIIQMFYLQDWVDKNLDGVVDDSEWIVEYDFENDGIAEMTRPTPIPVEPVISDQTASVFAGNDGELFYYYVLDATGCATDIKSETDLETALIGTPDGVVDDNDRIAIDMKTWLTSMVPWYDQPVSMVDTVVNTYTSGTTTVSVAAYNDPNLIWDATYINVSAGGGANAWQADWYWTGDRDGDPLTVDPVRRFYGDPDIYDFDGDPATTGDNYTTDIEIEFIDWGNPLENIYPTVGKRFPLEVALYEQVAECTADNVPVWGTPMIAYKMACLEYPSSKIELFGTSNGPNPTPGSFSYYSCFASVITDKFYAEVWNPDGTITKIPVEPGIGPSGKMNFASAGGGWMPAMPGWHRIWLHFNDPLINLTRAIVNNDEHYTMWTGCKVQDLNANKLEQVGIIGDSTYVDVYVSLPSGKRKK